MRVKISPDKLHDFLKKIREKEKLPWKELANACNVTLRTFRDWRIGKYTMPLDSIKKLSVMYHVAPPPIEKRIDDYWYASKGGRISGPLVFKKYGNIGTLKSRSLGGLRSIETHRQKLLSPFNQKSIVFPSFSESLAEFIGIILGDGGITKYQTTITLNRDDDREYVFYVNKLIQKLFDVSPSIYRHRRDKVSNIVISRAGLVSFLEKMGMSIGNKVKHQITPPQWILEKDQYIQRCARGLFDTDGSFYIDTHYYKNKIYYNCAMNFTNHSIPLLLFFKNSLKRFNLNPTQKTEFAIFLRREYDIVKYFQIIGSSNPKHIKKFEQYFKTKYGGVPKWS